MAGRLVRTKNQILEDCESKLRIMKGFDYVESLRTEIRGPGAYIMIKEFISIHVQRLKLMQSKRKQTCGNR